MKYSVLVLLLLPIFVQADGGKEGKEGESGKGGKEGESGKGGKTSGGGGDPHFRTLDGTLYSFHGECDLVMAHSASYSGLGLEIHARTKIVDDWSLISNLALRIGNDTFEIANDGSHYFNGANDVELPLPLAEQYLVSKGEDMISTFEEDGTSKNVAQQMYTFHLANDNVVRVSVFRSMITVNVVGVLEGTRGLLGTAGVDGLIGRDGVTKYEDPVQMGMEWQVNDNEPMLFHDVSGPQYPERCAMPSTTFRRRLRTYSDAFLKLAQEKCAQAPVDLQKLCLDDIKRVGDVNIALGYAF